MIKTTNNKKYRIGLVLSGGGARGCAHLGVYKAMQELNIRPDIISGTSAGAIAGVMLSSGHTAEESLQFLSGSKLLNFARPTMSKMGIMTLNGMEKQLANFIQVKNFEQLKIPLVITTTNMNSGQPEHFSQGEIIPAVIASSSVPIVFVPITINGQQYVDGGVFMNLPARPIRDLCDILIGVHIDPVEPNNHIKNMMHLAERSFHMGILSNMNVDADICDILIKPEHLSQYSMFKLENIQEIFDAGYNEAKKIFAKNKVTKLLEIKAK